MCFKMNYYNEIKNILIDNIIYSKVKDYSKNKHDLESYYEVGKLLIEAQGGEARAKYGDNLIKEYSRKLTKELGNGFSFIDSEYKIKIGNNYNYIDILLFNYKYNCFTVIELKVIELKKEHIGQISTYMHYIDKFVKDKFHDKTIGIIITRKDNKFIMKYSSDERILSRVYQLI